MKTTSLILFFCFSLPAAAQVVIGYNNDSPPVQFGITKLEDALEKSAASVSKVEINDANASDAEIQILTDEAHPGLISEGYEIMRRNGKLLIYALDPSGAMYGAMDVAEQLRMGKKLSTVAPGKSNPHFSVRAIKFNLPWSSYRTGLAMSAHMETCRDLDFWSAFLDQMAVNRFNLLSLWNVHPFSFMVKPVNFPHANNFSEREMDEWKSFWTALFRMCRERGIEPFIVNWNIAVSPEFAAHYGVMERNDTSAIVKKYTREVVTQVINEYPDLAGIGITLADWMSNFRQPGSSLPEMTPVDREEWITETVVAGIKAADRPIRFLHRSVLSADPREMRKVIDEANLPDTTLVEVKFNWSHGHSTPKLLITHGQHSGEVENSYWDPLPDNYRIEWMVRNEDFFILRWGQPDFIRKHIRINSKPYVNGYFVGSEGYIPAKDIFHDNADHKSWKYAFEKQWLFYKLWGRLLFDPSTPDAVFSDSFAKRYGIDNSAEMLAIYTAASRMPLRLASFHGATWDYTLYSEGFLAPFPSNGGLHDTLSSFISVDELIHHRPLDPKFISIADFARADGESKLPAAKVSPLILADSLEADGTRVIGFVRKMRPATGTLACELDDLETWAYLSLYFADKLRAGVALQTFRVSNEPAKKAEAITLLGKCLEHWRKVSSITDGHYKTVPYIDDLGYGRAYKDARTFSWSKFLPQAERDITIAREAVPK